MAKRHLDIIVSVVALLTLAPVFAVSALLVRRGSPGPFFYSQLRLGLYGRPFRLWKFRTMHAGAPDVRGTIELLPDTRFRHALRDLGQWSHIWVLFWFDRNDDWKPLVLPPRSTQKRGVFATRSPHRPNPIGMSALKLERIEGRVLHVVGLDILDGTPVLDIKPYVPYADSIPDARSGWADEAITRTPVEFAPEAEAALSLRARRAAMPQLRGLITEVL